MMRGISDNRGFTLIEVLACMGIITAGLISIITIRNNNIEQTQANECMNKAVEYASGKIEELVIDYRQNGRFSRTSGWFDQDKQYGWSVANREITIAEEINVMELTFTITYPGLYETKELTITRIVEIPNVR